MHNQIRRIIQINIKREKLEEKDYQILTEILEELNFRGQLIIKMSKQLALVTNYLETEIGEENDI